MKAILAMSENKGIGFNNSIPWTNKHDLKFFKEFTDNKIVIMGINTYVSLGSKPLPNRLNVVITSKRQHYNTLNEHSNVLFMNFSMAIDIFNGNQNAIIIGGALVYRQFEKYIDEYYITHIKGKDIICDTFFVNDLSNLNKYLYKILPDNTEVYKYKRIN